MIKGIWVAHHVYIHFATLFWSVYIENTSLVVCRGHSLTACKIQNGRQGAPIWPTGSGKGSNPMLLTSSNHFRLNKFSDPSTSSMRKGRNGEKMGKKMKKKQIKNRRKLWPLMSLTVGGVFKPPPPWEPQNPIPHGTWEVGLMNTLTNMKIISLSVMN